MRLPLSLLCCSLLLAASALAAPAYEPKFARVQEPGGPLGRSLCARPEYPRASLRNEETGIATYGFKVAPTGRVSDPKVLRSSGFRALDEAGLKALDDCLMRPASIKGLPVPSWQNIQFVWTLE